jgi:hypothetical protein
VVGEHGQHGAIGGGRGEAHRRAERLDGLDQLRRRGLLDEHAGRADAHRKQHQAAEAEGEGDGRRADEDVVAVRLQHVAAVGVAGRQQVAVEVHGALGLAGGARREADEADVLGRGVDRGEIAGGGGHAGLQAIAFGAAEADDVLQVSLAARAFSRSSARRASQTAWLIRALSIM